MGIIKQETHRPGAFKQTNKAHKTGRHRSKGSISSDVKGKVGIKSLSKHASKNLSKEARRHQLAQLRKNKRDQVLQQKRNLGGSDSAPILVCLIPLQEDLNVQNALSILTKADENAIVTSSSCGITHISVPRFKQRFSIIIPPIGNVFATLDAAKVATTTLFLVSTVNEDNTVREEIIDPWGKEILMSCLAQGLSTPVVAVTDLEQLQLKKRHDFKNQIQIALNKWLPEEKIFQLDTVTDALNVLKRIGCQKQKNIAYKKKRPHLLAEELKFNCDDATSDIGTLMISGYLREVPLSVNGLIHIPGLGDFQMLQIDAPKDPHPMEIKQRKNADAMDEEPSTRMLEKADPNKQESLEIENIPDPMDAEQTWPTEEELAEADAARKKKIVKKVPKGTSEYQAAWIPDEDGEELNDEYSDEELEDRMSLDEAKSHTDSDVEADAEEYETITVSEAAPDEQKYDQDMDMIEENIAREKLKLAKLDAQFPDEVDTPQDMLAKIRFQKYRGLESFRSSAWDPKENLPNDYARIFQFKNFDRTRKRVFKEAEDTEGAMPGWYITIHVANVRRDLFTAFSTIENRPMIVFGLLPNEQKMSLLNIVLKHTNISSEPIKSKERLVFQCGFRRFAACPIFSQHTNGNKHKYERYFQPETTVVASMYAQITFPPCPVLCYAEKSNGSMELIATGGVLSANPDRIVVKRIVLSGHPFKVLKRSAVVRFMFFHREDINWFKPVQLRTKYGRRGHIKEPLGTHGHMKCVFNGQLKSQDTVLMNLYKRVFPKWVYEPLLVTESSNADNERMNVE